MIPDEVADNPAPVRLPSRGEAAGEALAFAGGLAGFAVAMLLLTFWHPFYTSYDGIVGPPAALGYAPHKKVWGYLIALALSLMGALAVLAFRHGRAGRERHWAWLPAMSILLGAAAVAMLGLAVHRLPEPYRAPFVEAAQSRRFWVHAGAGMLALLFLVLRPIRRSASSGEEAAVDPISSFVIIAFHLWVIFEAFTQQTGFAVGLSLLFTSGALGYGLLARRTAAVSATPKPESGLVMVRHSWWVLAAYPLTAIYIRFALTVDWPGEELRFALLLSGLGIAYLVVTGSIRRSEPFSRLRPLLLIPFAIAVLYRGAGISAFEFDPYHEGEYIYSYKALQQGLMPFRDIFYVHGFGFNTIAGWAMDPWLASYPSLATFFLDLMLVAGLIVMGFFYLRTFGSKWWILAVALTALTAGAVATKGSRFLPLYLMLFAMGEYYRSGRAVWIVLSGAIASLGVFFSLDTGVVALFAGTFWACYWSAIGRAEMRDGGFDWKPLGSFAGGAALVGVAAGAIMAAAGILGDFISIHWEYARMKAHYDNLPLPTRGLVYFLSPALTVVGAYILVRRLAARSGRDEPLIGLISFLTAANFLLFMRGLDRSDEGHLIYGSAMAWPLLGCLVVFRAKSATRFEAYLRSAAVAALLVLLPHAHAMIQGAATPVVPAQKMVEWYADNSGRPAANHRRFLRSSFFEACRRLQRLTQPGDYLLDMTNRPGIYYFTHVRCPTRFYATFYMSPVSWQREIIARMEETGTPWVLWPASGGFGEKIDGIDIRERHKLLAEYIEERFATVMSLPDGSELKRRKPEEGAPDPLGFSFGRGRR